MENYLRLKGCISHVGRGLVSRWPEGPTKYAVRNVVKRGELAGEQTVVTIDGTTGRFLMRNRSDRRRLGEDFEREFASQLLASIGPNDTFLDIGSAQGLYSILAAQKGARVYAVDPDPVSYRSIRDNFKLNSGIARSVHVLPTALGNARGRVDLHIDSGGSAAPSFVQTTESLTETRRVKMRTVDGLIARGKIARPSVVKIDVEGAEGMVLRGMTKLLQSENRPRHLFLELHSPEFLEKFGTNQEEVLRQMYDMGYVPVQGDFSPRDHEQHYHFVPRN